MDGVSTESGLLIRWSRRWLYRPKEDISTYELALLIPILLSSMAGQGSDEEVEDLPEGARRHFVELSTNP